MAHDALPTPGTHIWVLVDLSNSNPNSKNYLWWFETRDLARQFKAEHTTRKHASTLSAPIKMYVEGTR